MFDLKYLAIVFLFALLTISTTFNFLNMSAEQEGDDFIFIADTTGYKPIDAFIYTYLIGIGQLLHDFSSTNMFICWVIFIFATFLNLIVFMNMIIA